MNKFYNLKLTRKSTNTSTSSRMFIVTLLSALPLLVHSAAFAQNTDRLLPLENMSKSVKEWNLLKDDVKKLVAKSRIKNAVDDKKLTSKLDSKMQPLNNEQLSLLEMSDSIKEWDLLKSDVKALILAEAQAQAEKKAEIEKKAQAEIDKLQSEKVEKERIKIKSTNLEQWGVQIGAYLLPKYIDEAIKDFHEKSSSLQSTTLLYREFKSKENGGDDIFRLKIGPFSTRALANSHCNKLIKTNVNCFPVKLINTHMVTKQ